MSNDFVVGVAVSSQTLLFAILILSGFLCLAILISMMRIYKKAGKPQISAVVPIWAQIVLFQIVDKPAWYIFLMLVPIVNIVIMFQTYILLAKKFGKGTGFGIGMIFLPMIFIPLLSFYDYVGNEEKSEEPIYNPFNELNVAQVMPSAPIENAEVNNDNESVPVAPTILEPIQSTPVNTSNFTNENQLVEENLGVQNDVFVEEVENNELIIPEVEPVVENEVLENLEPVIDNVEPKAENPNVQDIEKVLNQKIETEQKDIAFGGMPQIEQENSQAVSDNLVESLNLQNEVLETTVVEDKINETANVEESIEMPEIAAKTCPACGVSLAEEVKFCTSCGTQL